MAGQAVYKDDAHKNLLVARNSLLQFDEVQRIASQQFGNLALSAELLRHLQGVAIQDIYDCAGTFRQWPVIIHNTAHAPPPHTDVPHLVDDMCAYTNSVAHREIHAAAYVMWRLNWIHPFGGGNGRTSRAASYLVLCATLKTILPGTRTIPEMIAADRTPYYRCLDMADLAWANGVLDVSMMEGLLGYYLTLQLQSAV